MNLSGLERELLLRQLDGRLEPEECPRAAELLRTNPAARAFVREVAEQAVMVADLERIAASRAAASNPSVARQAGEAHPTVLAGFRWWPWGVAVAAGLTFLAVLAFQFFPSTQREIVRVTKVTGVNQFFGATGRMENALTNGASLRAGDTVDTRSCDAWIELRLRDGSAITIAGHSTLRILDAEAGGQAFKLLRGSLWVNPARSQGGESILIQTPTLAAESRGAQLDVQTSSAETMLRVNEGSARVEPLLDGSAFTVLKGHQVTASFNKGEPLSATPQPTPINYWSCDLSKVPEVILGKWLPPTDTEKARLGADPLLWPIPGRDPVMLYAAAIAAWKSTDHPVLLHTDSKLRFRGRTERAQRVRFGFSAQKMRGVFAGKFEVDVQPASLGPPGATWEVNLPLAEFRPLHPHLAASPEGLELTEVYALTIREDAGLEINHIELTPAGPDVPLLP